MNKKSRDFLPSVFHDHADYLDFYFNDVTRNYAILIDGDWGSGKTFFVDQYWDAYCQTLQSDPPYVVKISLYGIKDFADVERQLVPRQIKFINGDKTQELVKNSGWVLRWLIKAVNWGLKLKGIPFGVPDEFAFPKINIRSLFRLKSNVVLIFDDLERCEMDPEEILGKINYLCEVVGHKIIIIANQGEIHPKKRKKFRKTKEKLVGKVLKVHPDIDSALDLFIEKVKSDSVRTFLKAEKGNLRRIFLCSDYSNLRSLHAGITEFERICGILPPKALRSGPLMHKLINTLFVLVYETRAGKIRIPTIKFLPKLLVNKRRGNGEETKNKYQDIEFKYVPFSFWDMFPSHMLWQNFFENGTFKIADLNSEIDNSEFFYDDNTPTYIKLWKYELLEFDHFQRLLGQLYQELDDGKYVKEGELKHILGILISLAKDKLISIPVEEVCEHVLVKTKGLLNSSKLVVENPHATMGDSYLGKVFLENKSPEFIEAAKKISLAFKQAKEDKYPEFAEELLEYVRLGMAQVFWRKLSPQSEEGSKWHNVPILAYIDPSKFADAYIQCSNQAKPFVDYVFDDRFGQRGKSAEYEIEKDWALEVSKQLKKRMIKLNVMDYHNVETFIKYRIDRHLVEGSNK